MADEEYAEYGDEGEEQVVEEEVEGGAEDGEQEEGEGRGFAGAFSAIGNALGFGGDDGELGDDAEVEQQEEEESGYNGAEVEETSYDQVGVDEYQGEVGEPANSYSNFYSDGYTGVQDGEVAGAEDAGEEFYQESQVIPNVPSTYGGEPPTYGDEPPTYGDEPPTYGNEPPTYGNEPPTYGNEPPTYGDEPPTYGNEPPTYGGEQSGGVGLSGTEAPGGPENVAKTIKADVRMFSGCMDSQTSADVHDVSKFGLPDADGAGGACTNAMLVTLADEHPDSWLGLLKGMRNCLQDKQFSQIPQLSTSRQIDVNDRFSLRHEGGEGNTKCLLIGINYIGQQGQLNGCHNDVEAMKEYVTSHGYSMDETNCMTLMDDDVHCQPTRENITAGFRWLVADAKAGDSLFMHYSGHGGSVQDSSGDEEDRKDETLVPVDYQSSGMIADDEILRELVLSIPEDVMLTVVMDCCHSGSILDLPYTLKADESTISAVEAGDVSSTISANANFAEMLKMGNKLHKLFNAGNFDGQGLGNIGSSMFS